MFVMAELGKWVHHLCSDLLCHRRYAAIDVQHDGFQRIVISPVLCHWCPVPQSSVDEVPGLDGGRGDC